MENRAKIPISLTLLLLGAYFLMAAMVLAKASEAGPTELQGKGSLIAAGIALSIWFLAQLVLAHTVGSISRDRGVSLQGLTRTWSSHKDRPYFIRLARNFFFTSILVFLTACLLMVLSGLTPMLQDWSERLLLWFRSFFA